MATVSVETGVMSLSETALFLRVSEDAILRLVATQGLQGRNIEGQWRFMKSEVEDWLCHRSPKARMLATAGSLKGDPYFDEFIRNIEEQREKSRSEGI